MHSLRLLGGFALTDSAGMPLRRLSQPRAEAVLAVLAVSGELGCTRDRLLGLLWPESDQSRARHSLRDSLHSVRQALGGEAIVASGELLFLNPSVVTSDVQAFERLAAESSLAEAVRGYRGPLLEGFHLDNAPEFERWLDDSRTRLGREYAEALELLAARSEAEDAWTEAAGWWARAVEHDPHNSRLVLRRMRALVMAGDRANALREAESHRQRLRKELEIEPDAEFDAEVAHLRNGGLAVSVSKSPAPRSKPVTPPTALDAPAVAAERSEVVASGEDASRAARARWSRLRVGVASAAGALGLVAAVISWRACMQPAPVLDRQVIAVLPAFQPTGDTALTRTAARVVSVWMRALESGPAPHAAPSSAVTAALKSASGLGRRADTSRDRAAVADATLAMFVLSSSVERAGDQMRIRATMHRMPGDALQSSRSIVVSAEVIENAASVLLLQLLADWAGEPQHRVEWLSQRDPQAVRLYLSQAWRVRPDWNDVSVRNWIGEVLRHDSVLVHPALSYFYTMGVWPYIVHEPWHDTIAGIAWRRRDALPREDRACVEAVFGPWFGLADDEEARIALWRRATVEAGDWWRPWFHLGAELSALGPATSIRSWRREAEYAFGRALALSDTSRTEVVDLAFWFKLFPGSSREEGSRPFTEIDTAGAKALIAAGGRRGLRAGGLYVTSPADWTPGLATARGDRSADDYWTTRALGSHATEAIRVVTAIASALPVAAPTADATVRAWEATRDAGNPSLAHWWAGSWWRTRGKHDHWTRSVRASLRVLPEDYSPTLNNITNDQGVVLSLLYLGYPFDGLARSAVARLQRIVSGDSVPTPDSGAVGVAHCWLAQWRLAQSDTAGVARAIGYLRALDRRDHAGKLDGLPNGQRWAVCPALLEAQLARVTGRRQLQTARALDALLRPMPVPRRGLQEAWEASARHDLTRFIENLLAARLLGAAGDTAAALAASRRYPRDIQTIVDFVVTLPEYLREEARFAAALGDTVGAVRTYERYLALRKEPPEYRPWRATWDSVRTEFAALRPRSAP